MPHKASDVYLSVKMDEPTKNHIAWLAEREKSTISKMVRRWLVEKLETLPKIPSRTKPFKKLSAYTHVQELREEADALLAIALTLYTNKSETHVQRQAFDLICDQLRVVIDEPMSITKARQEIRKIRLTVAGIVYTEEDLVPQDEVVLETLMDHLETLCER